MLTSLNTGVTFSPASAAESDSASTLAHTMSDLNLRGEKLQELDEKTKQLKAAASDFQIMAKQLKNKQRR